MGLVDCEYLGLEIDEVIDGDPSIDVFDPPSKQHLTGSWSDLERRRNRRALKAEIEAARQAKESAIANGYVPPKRLTTAERREIRIDRAWSAFCWGWALIAGCAYRERIRAERIEEEARAMQSQRERGYQDVIVDGKPVRWFL